MNLLSICVLFLAFQGDQEPSNPPTPSAGKEPQKSEQETRKTEKHPSGDLSPPPNPVHTDLDVENDGGPHPEQKPNSQISDWMGWVEIFFRVAELFTTIVLVTTTIVLAWFTKKLWKTARHHNRIASRQCGLTGKQYRLNRLIFYTENRPRLRVRKLVIKDVERADRAVVSSPAMALTSEKLEGLIEFHNIGDTPATPLQFYIYPVISRSLRSAQPQPWEDVQSKAVPPGTFYRIKFGPCDQPSNINLVGYPGWFVYLIGAIRYKDDTGGIRDTAFCRRFDPDTKRFDPVENNDYEYED